MDEEIRSMMYKPPKTAPTGSRSVVASKKKIPARPVSARVAARKKSVSFNDPRSNPSEHFDDVMPEGASEMGAEAQLRLLKAKVSVLQEELKATSEELRVEVEDHGRSKKSTKEIQEEAERLRKSNAQQHSSIQKLKGSLESEKKGSEARALQLQAANKELEANRRERKQQNTAHTATEVRLNRALEELEKNKSLLAKERHKGKEDQEKLAGELEELRGNNKRLERVRLECMNLIKKQQSLVGVLKKQIVHIEASKLLSFTEEDFVKLLDWDKA